MENKFLLLLIILIGIGIGGISAAMITQGFTGNAGLFRNELQDSKQTISELTDGDQPKEKLRINQKIDLTITVINASNDANLEYELQDDLTRAGYTVLRVMRDTPKITTSALYKSSKEQEFMKLNEWLSVDYPIQEYNSKLNESETSDVILTLGIDVENEL